MVKRKTWSAPNSCLTTKDWWLIILLLAVYIPLSLFNLGSREVPETYWKPAENGDTFMVDFGQDFEIERMAFYSGFGATDFYIDFYTDERRQTGSIIISQDFPCVWHFEDIDLTGRYARIISMRSGNMIQELAFFAQGIKEPLEIMEIFEENINPDSEGEPAFLFDEQALVPDRPSFMTGMYFDELYFARSAFEHLNRQAPFDSVQPPLAKVLIALGIALFGMNPFGWRIVNALIGAAMIPLVYLFGKRLFGKTEFAFLAAFFLTFDFMHFAHTRFATLEGIMVFFIILMYFFMYEFVSRDFFTGNRQSLYLPLFLSGVFYGLASASKLNGIYAGLGLAVIFFWALRHHALQYRQARQKLQKEPEKSRPAESARLNDIVSLFPVNRNRVLAWCVPFFILIPLGVYLLSFIPILTIPDHGFSNIIQYQSHMYRYHRFLEATHPFASPWYEWPVMARPIWMYQGKDLPEGFVSSIVSFGNPVVWWGGLFAFFFVLWSALRERNRTLIYIVLALASQYLPWVMIPRLTFIYHYFASVPFLIFGLVYTLGHIEKSRPWGRSFLIITCILTVALFVLFYPVLSGLIVPRSYVASYLRWLPSWFFY